MEPGSRGRAGGVAGRVPEGSENLVLRASTEGIAARPRFGSTKNVVYFSDPKFVWTIAIPEHRVYLFAIDRKLLAIPPLLVTNQYIEPGLDK